MAYDKKLSALADPTRRRIFERLRTGRRPAGELARGLPVSRPAVSQHLRVLLDAGLVSRRREGTRQFYEMNRDGLAELRSYVESLWEDVLSSFKRSVECGRPADREGGSDE